jgi:exodeoxyribonuclease V alpha subunit
VLFNRENKKHLSLAYALTVHKSQGSQYRRVVVVCLSRDAWGLLDRALLYTAVTRAKAQCTVVGQPRAFQDALGRVGSRVTALQEIAALAGETKT